MHELNINILRTPSRSFTRKILGVIYLTVGILWILTRIFFDDPVPAKFPRPLFDIVYSLVFGVTGIVFIIEGTGRSISSWFGEAYLKVDNESIHINRSIKSKELQIVWSDIQQVEYKLLSINFLLIDGSIQELTYDNLEYEHIQALKSTIRDISESKGLPILS